MFGLYASNQLIGYLSLSEVGEGVFELHNLAVLPAYRHRGFGKLLLDHAKETVRHLNGHTITLGLIDEDTRLKDWYTANGFVYVGARKYDHLPFTSGYMEWKEHEP
ncbi:MAG: GNAT family N-acetyltransferase, partial [Clostridia bacterium]|nr:GNAT family N-acetyltransferase [Clostridia bacterium]